MYIEWENRCSFEQLNGKTITEITGMELGNDSIVFACDDGSEYTMYHEQRCCESVAINDVEGDVSDLIGSPIVLAEESSSDNHSDPEPSDDYVQSCTWTFYRIATAKGFVVLRWLGESNGYYSESVYFAKTK